MVFMKNSNWYKMYLLRKINRPLGFFGFHERLLQHTRWSARNEPKTMVDSFTEERFHGGKHIETLNNKEALAVQG